jgi:hypothetical protein
MSEQSKIESLERKLARLKVRHVANIKARDDARDAAASALALKAQAEKELADLRYRLAVPVGAKRLDAWEYKGQLIVCGDPVDTDGDVDHPHAHNCDAMGCSSVSHVLIREPLTEWGTLAPRPALPRSGRGGQQ